jgi:hypothetical protein
MLHGHGSNATPAVSEEVRMILASRRDLQGALKEKGGIIMGILSDLSSGGEKESHGDGSVTEHFSDGTSIKRNSDGSMREYTTHETVLPLGLGDKMTVTHDGDGNTTNAQ